MKLDRTLPATALGEVLSAMMREGEIWKFTFKKTGEHVNILKFGIRDPDAEQRIHES